MPSAHIIPYRSRRALSGLGETSASQAGDYAAYARAIYQAINGDVVGGAYNAALTFAGPIAAIGNAIADFANRSADVKSAATQALIDAFAKIPGWIYTGGRVPTLVMPGTPQCRSLRADGYARALSEAIRKKESPETVKAAAEAWFATGKPWYGACIPLEQVSPPAQTSVVSTPAPASTSIVTPTELPPVVSITPAPAPVVPSPITSTPVISTSAQMFVPTSITPAVPIAATSPDVTVNLPVSVPPDQTPLLIQQWISQGATQQQAMTAALKSLAARGVAPTPAIQARVASDTRASALQLKSPAGMILIAALIAGIGFLIWERS